jgi:Zn-dependent protease with chaperone function
MDTSVVLYRKTAYDAPLEVQILLYQDAIQLYDVHTSAFISSLPLKNISHFTQKEEQVTVHFKDSDDVKLMLEDDHPLLPELQKAEKKKLLRPGGKVFVLTSVVIAAILLLNYIFSLVVADIGLRIISPQYEAQLGEQMFSSSVPQTLVDERRTAIVQAFTDKLQLSDTYKIQVTVLRSAEINAFAVPGGHIVVYTGLLDKMQHYDELVALLSHETTHINERHTTRSILKQLSSKLFLIFFMDVSQVGGVLLLNADKLRALSYSRSLEKEADEKGLKIMLRNKVDVNGMLGMFNRLKEADTTGTPVFLNTHPLTEKRIRYTMENIKKLHQVNAVVDPVLQELWQNLQKKEDTEADPAE